MPPQIPLPFTLRPTQEAHPEQVQAQRVSKENARAVRAQTRKTAITKVAQVEADIRQAHEEKLSHAHNPPPVAIDRVPHPRPPGNVGDLEDGGEEILEGEVEDVNMGTGEVAGDDAVEKSTGKKQKQAKSKKGLLREEIQSAVKPSPPLTAKQGKHKANAEEEHVPNKKPKNSVTGGLVKNWKEILEASTQPSAPDLGSSHANEFSRSSTPCPESATVSSKVSMSGSTTVSSKVSDSVSSACKKPTQVNSDQEDEENLNGALSEIEEHFVGSGRTASQKLAPRLLERTYATASIIPITSVPTFVPPTHEPSRPHAKERICTSHLPPRLVPRFEGLFSPHLRVIFGNSGPWAAPSEDAIKDIWTEVFPEEDPLDYTTPLGSIVQKLIVDRLSSWRHNLGHAGLVALNSKVFPALPEDNNITRVRSEWCRWAVSRTEGDHPFYFADVLEDEDGNLLFQSGIFQSKLVSAILGSHINSIAPLHINVKADRPIGALILAIQSAKRTVTFHLTGVECRPRRPAADFSKANWGDHLKYTTDGRLVPVHPTSTLVDLVHQLKPKQWEKILAAAKEDSKINLNFEAAQLASLSSIVPTQNRPKPQLRDDDSDICIVE
ncbi:hypothetical protein V8E53_002243 [Lactarius tabidus]